MTENIVLSEYTIFL